MMGLGSDVPAMEVEDFWMLGALRRLREVQPENRADALAAMVLDELQPLVAVGGRSAWEIAVDAALAVARDAGIEEGDFHDAWREVWAAHRAGRRNHVVSRRHH